MEEKDSTATSLMRGSDAPSSTGSSQAMQEGGYGTAGETEPTNHVEQAKDFFTNPVQDLLETKDELLSIKDFWHDMKKRERAGFHQATLIVGTVMALVIAAYCVVVRLSHYGEQAPIYSSYLAGELGIAALAQLFFSYQGICLENSPMVLIANINAIGVTVRLALSIHLQLVTSALSIAFLVTVSLLTIIHMFTSFHAWGGEFTRYITFVIGTEGHIQLMYRQYQFMTAIAFMDLEFLAMASMTIFFFLEDSIVETILIVVGFFLVSIAIRSALRHSVRKETTYGLLILVPVIPILSPILMDILNWESLGCVKLRPLPLSSSFLFESLHGVTTCHYSVVFLLQLLLVCVGLQMIPETLQPT